MGIINNYVEKLDKYSLFNLTEIPGLDPKDMVPEIVDLTKLVALGKLLVTRKGNFFKVEGKDPKWVSVYSCTVQCSTASTLYGELNILFSNLPEGAYITVNTVIRITGRVHSRELIQKELNRLTKKEIFEKVDKLTSGSVLYRKVNKTTQKVTKGVDEFITFLKDRGIYEAFEKNYKIQRRLETPNVRDYLIGWKVDTPSLMSSAFLWTNTPEGREYWLEVDRQFKEYLFDLHKDDLKPSQILKAFRNTDSEDESAYHSFLNQLSQELWSID